VNAKSFLAELTRRNVYRMRIIGPPSSVSLTLWALIAICGALGRQALAEEATAMPPDTSWTLQEKWVWSQVSQGKVADFNSGSSFGGRLLPKDAATWPAQRNLSQRFLETITLYEPYRSRVPYQGIRIVGAKFPEGLVLAPGNLDRVISLTECVFRGPFDLSDGHMGRSMILDGSIFLEVRLRRAAFAGDVGMRGVAVTGPLNMEGVVVDGSLELSDAILGGADQALILRGGKIGGQLRAANISADRGTANMDSLSVGGNLSLRGEGDARKARCTVLWLASARIGGQCDLSDADIADVNLNSAGIGNDLWMRNSNFETVRLRNARIGGDLAFEGPKVRSEPSRLRKLDLEGARIEQALILGSVWYGPINWPAEASMNLAGVSVRHLQDGFTDCADLGSECWSKWPRPVTFAGFDFHELLTWDNEMTARPATWWLARLDGQERIIPASYRQLAAAFSAAGYEDKAKAVSYAGGNRELRSAQGFSKASLWLQRIFIGYGFRLWYSAFWALGLVLLGAFLLRFSKQGKKNKMPYGIAYSFDMLLPIVKLRELHYTVDLQGWVRYYFYVHKLMGYVLASFLIAGLSGLTK